MSIGNPAQSIQTMLHFSLPKVFWFILQQTAYFCFFKLFVLFQKLFLLPFWIWQIIRVFFIHILGLDYWDPSLRKAKMAWLKYIFYPKYWIDIRTPDEIEEFKLAEETDPARSKIVITPLWWNSNCLKPRCYYYLPEQKRYIFLKNFTPESNQSTEAKNKIIQQAIQKNEAYEEDAIVKKTYTNFLGKKITRYYLFLHETKKFIPLNVKNSLDLEKAYDDLFSNPQSEDFAYVNRGNDGEFKIGPDFYEIGGAKVNDKNTYICDVDRTLKEDKDLTPTIQTDLKKAFKNCRHSEFAIIAEDTYLKGNKIDFYYFEGTKTELVKQLKRYLKAYGKNYFPHPVLIKIKAKNKNKFNYYICVPTATDGKFIALSSKDNLINDIESKYFNQKDAPKKPPTPLDLCEKEANPIKLPLTKTQYTVHLQYWPTNKELPTDPRDGENPNIPVLLKKGKNEIWVYGKKGEKWDYTKLEHKKFASINFPNRFYRSLRYILHFLLLHFIGRSIIRISKSKTRVFTQEKDEKEIYDEIAKGHNIDDITGEDFLERYGVIQEEKIKTLLNVITGKIKDLEKKETYRVTTDILWTNDSFTDWLSWALPILIPIAIEYIGLVTVITFGLFGFNLFDIGIVDILGCGTLFIECIIVLISGIYIERKLNDLQNQTQQYFKKINNTFRSCCSCLGFCYPQLYSSKTQNDIFKTYHNPAVSSLEVWTLRVYLIAFVFFTVGLLFSLIFICPAGIGGSWATICAYIYIVYQALNFCAYSCLTVVHIFYLMREVLIPTWNKTMLLVSSTFKKGGFSNTCAAIAAFFVCFIAIATWRTLLNARLYKILLMIFILFWSLVCRVGYGWVYLAHIRIIGGGHHIFSKKTIGWYYLGAGIAILIRGLFNLFKDQIWFRYKCWDKLCNFWHKFWQSVSSLIKNNLLGKRTEYEKAKADGNYKNKILEQIKGKITKYNEKIKNWLFMKDKTKNGKEEDITSEVEQNDSSARIRAIFAAAKMAVKGDGKNVKTSLQGTEEKGPTSQSPKDTSIASHDSVLKVLAEFGSNLAKFYNISKEKNKNDQGEQNGALKESMENLKTSLNKIKFFNLSESSRKEIIEAMEKSTPKKNGEEIKSTTGHNVESDLGVVSKNVSALVKLTLDHISLTAATA